MNPGQNFQKKILKNSDLQEQVKVWRSAGKSIVFTNGCFDIIHAGHISSLQQAAQQGDILVVGVNADETVRNLKGADRPVNNETSRTTVLAALQMVDAVTLFTEPTPKELILAIKPDVLVKGGDYKIDEIAGAKEVQEWGGRVIINPILSGYSTTSIINKIQNSPT